MDEVLTSKLNKLLPQIGCEWICSRSFTAASWLSGLAVHRAACGPARRHIRPRHSKPCSRPPSLPHREPQRNWFQQSTSLHGDTKHRHSCKCSWSSHKALSQLHLHKAVWKADRRKEGGDHQFHPHCQDGTISWGWRPPDLASEGK